MGRGLSRLSDRKTSGVGPVSDSTEWIAWGIVAFAGLVLVYRFFRRRKGGACCKKGCGFPEKGEDRKPLSGT